MARKDWTPEQVKLAFHLYCQLPFGRLHQGNPEVIALANLIERSPSAVAMKLVNFASLDPVITASGQARSGRAAGCTAGKAARVSGPAPVCGRRAAGTGRVTVAAIHPAPSRPRQSPQPQTPPRQSSTVQRAEMPATPPPRSAGPTSAADGRRA